MAGAWWGWNRVLPGLQQFTVDNYMPLPGMKDSQAPPNETVGSLIIRQVTQYIAATLIRVFENPVDMGMFCGLMGCLCFSWLATPLILSRLWAECIQPEPQFLQMLKHLVGTVGAPFAGPLLILGATQIPETHILGFLATWAFRIVLLLVGYVCLIPCFGLPILATILMFLSVAVWGAHQTLTVMAMPSALLLVATMFRGGYIYDEF